MFTGIIEQTGRVAGISREGSNVRLTITCPFVPELKVDQSVAHNGVCLTVAVLSEDHYEVICIDETLQRTNLGMLREGDEINLERSLPMNGRLDGHLVQGHVDETGIVKEILPANGSWIYRISYNNPSKNITVEKGSVCVNGVSLTVVESLLHEFTVAIIPYTFEHTNFRHLKSGDTVNLEFDILGKYISRLAELRMTEK